MIGVFDSGHGGIIIFRKLANRFVDIPMCYLGDHKNAPYGNREKEEVLDFTIKNVEILFQQNCHLVIIACNTATAIACRKIQQEWLPNSKYKNHNVLGIIAPTVEAATQTPWSVTTPQFPQKLNKDTIAVFATKQTVASNVYVEEIQKRCPYVKVVQQVCSHLAGAIEKAVPKEELQVLVHDYVNQLMNKNKGKIPQWSILGCTHYPIVQDLFEEALPQQTRLFCQPKIVTDSLEDYLKRHPQYVNSTPKNKIRILTTGIKTDLFEIYLKNYYPHAPQVEKI